MEVHGSNEEIPQRRVAVKRKMDCCDRNAKEQMKNKRKGTILCDYCQCVFDQRYLRDEHMKIHECSECHDIAIGDDARAHNLRHRQEVQLEQLKEQRQRNMDDEFVLLYVKANQLHKYRPQQDYEPNVEYIVSNHRLEKEEWLAFFKTFKRRFLYSFFSCFKDYLNWKQSNLIKKLNAQMISYLLENSALSVCDAIDFMNILITQVKYDDYVSMCLLYLLKKDCKIKAEWVARAINDDELVERIKEKHTFTFDEIHKARQWDSFSEFDVKPLKKFYTQLQKHFFNPNFESAFDDLLDEDIENVQCSLDSIYQRNRFIYDKEEDQLTMLEGSGEWQQSHQLGSCTAMIEKSLVDLTKQYLNEAKACAILVRKVENLENEKMREYKREDDDYYDSCDDDDSCHEPFVYYGEAYDNPDCKDEFYEIKKAECERDEQERIVSKLYFVISMK